MFDKSKRGPHFINATILNIYLWKFGAVSILKVYGAALILTLLREDGSQRPSMFMNDSVAPRGQVTARNDPGRSPVTLEPRTRGWLTEAINGLVGLEDKGDYRKCSGRSPDVPVGLRSVPQALSHHII